MDTTHLSFENYHRRFGVEIEVNALDGRDFINYPLSDGEIPEGMDYIGESISRSIKEPVVIRSWHYTHNNNQWVLKSDRSCGIEICSPVSNGKYGLSKICDVLDVLNHDERIPIDHRCSLHIHVNVSDCTRREVASILGCWIKAEPVFIDSLPAHRKKSRYFQCIGASNLIGPMLDSCDVLERLLGMHKYMTINTYHKMKNNRPTIEFRIMGSEGCRCTDIGRNWIILVMHFVEMAKKKQLFNNYANLWSNLLWDDPRQVMEFLGFMGDYELSEDLINVRRWFLRNLKLRTGKGTGFWGMESRGIAAKQVHEIISELRLDI